MKSRRKKAGTLPGPLRGHRAQFEPLEERCLLTAATVSGSSEITTSVAPAALVQSLPTPTISLPTVVDPINGSCATPVRGVWVADAGSQDITVTLSVEHGTLLASGDFTVSGDGTSTIVLTGTAENIYDSLNPHLSAVAVPANVSMLSATVSTPSDTDSGNVGNSEGPGLFYVADSGFTGTDVLTAAAVGSAGGESRNPVLPLATVIYSPTATSKLLLDVVPQVSAPVIHAPSSVQPTDPSAPSIVFQGTGNTISMSDPSVGSQPIQVTLAVGNGTLTLSGTTGLTISGGGNGSDWMTLTGSVADINSALDGLTCTPGTSQGGNDSLVVQLSDLGNTGLRTPQTTSAFVSIRTPGLLVPSSTQDINPGSPLVFDTANGNEIVANDFDVAGSEEELQLSVWGGTLTLAQTTGLTFVPSFSGFVGANGTGSMTIEGSQTDIDNALAGLVFTPDADLSELATLSLNLYEVGNPSLVPRYIDSESIGIQVGPSTSPRQLAADDHRAAKPNHGLVDAGYVLERQWKRDFSGRFGLGRRRRTIEAGG